MTSACRTKTARKEEKTQPGSPKKVARLPLSQYNLIAK